MTINRLTQLQRRLVKLENSAVDSFSSSIIGWPPLRKISTSLGEGFAFSSVGLWPIQSADEWEQEAIASQRKLVEDTRS